MPMKNRDILEKKAKEIENRINKLEEKKKKLCSEYQLNEETPVYLKFKIWLNCSKAKLYFKDVDLDKFPCIKNLLVFDDKFNVNDITEKTDMIELWKEKFEYITNPTKFHKDFMTEKEKKLVINVMKEILKKNSKFCENCRTL